MSGLNRRMKRAIDKKQHKTMSETWKIAKALQKRKLDEASAEGRELTSDEMAKYVPNGRLLGHKPTFKQFVELKMQAIAEASKNAEAEQETTIEELSWENE